MRVMLLSGLAMLIAGCNGGDAPPLVAESIEISQPSPGATMSAGYLRLRNNTDEDIRISRVTSPQFASVDIHESSIEDGIARMRQIDELIVPAGGVAVLERGGKHLMLRSPGPDSSAVSLTFYSGDSIVLTTSIRRP